MRSGLRVSGCLHNFSRRTFPSAEAQSKPLPATGTPHPGQEGVPGSPAWDLSICMTLRSVSEEPWSGCPAPAHPTLRDAGTQSYREAGPAALGSSTPHPNPTSCKLSPQLPFFLLKDQLQHQPFSLSRASPRGLSVNITLWRDYDPS